MMPQKKNPDVAELVRGKTGRVIGDLVALLVTMKGLPLAYNRDLQEDKPSLVDAIETWSASVDVWARMLPSITFHADRMKAALAGGYVLATEVADYLAQKGVPFRDAHEVVGKIVGSCVASSRTLESLSLAELKAFHPAFEADVSGWLDAEKAIERRDLPGGPAKKRVLAAIAAARAELGA